MESSIRASSARTYASALSSLCLFLQFSRDASDTDADDLASLKKSEFIVYLANCLEQGRRTIEPVRSALLRLQRSEGVKTWAADRDIRRMCVGVVKGHTKSQKGAPSAKMMAAFLIWSKKQPAAHCNHCGHLSSKQWHAQLQLATSLQFAQGARPHQVRGLERSSVVGRQVLLLQKVGKTMQKLEPMRRGVKRIIRATKKEQFGTKPFVFARCVCKHIGQSSRRWSRARVVRQARLDRSRSAPWSHAGPARAYRQTHIEY